MTKLFKISFFALAFCANFALAQETPHENPTDHETPAAEPAHEVPAAEPAHEAPAAEPVAPVAEAPVTAELAPVASPVADLVESAPLAAKAASEIKVNMGFRIGLGLSNFRSHKALAFGEKAIIPGVDYSYGLGLATFIDINSLLSIAPELHYTFYSASGEYTIKQGADFEDMNEVLIYMHAIELPVLARFNLGTYYLEVGPQIGYNQYAKIYKNNLPKRPDLNRIAFGPSFGGGINMNGMLLGVRSYFGITEYAENSDGYPWSVQVSLTTFFSTFFF